MHEDGVRMRADDDMDARLSRFMTRDEIKCVAAVMQALEEQAGGLDIVSEIHDEKGLLLGVVRKIDDYGYCFMAEAGSA